MLLILDNLEQLRDVGGVVADLLVGDTVVIATSRAPLHIRAERELAVPPLDTGPAVELFLSRAAAVGRRIEADRTVTAICRRLDNLPLAIELAAARTRLLTPAALLERLDSALPLLSGGARDLPERQQTLRATIAWSYDLLDEAGQVALRRLSVFRGSFALEDAELVMGASLDEIEVLVDHSLVVAQPTGRCLLLETLREFARERLEDVGETREYDLRHAHYYLGILKDRASLLRTVRGGDVMRWLQLEEEHLATMLDRLSVYEPVEAAGAAYLLGPYWLRSGAAGEAQARLTTMLTLDLPDESRAMVLNRLSVAEDRLDHLDASYQAATASVALAEAAGAQTLLVDSLGCQALAAGRRGDPQEAVQIARRAADLAAGLDNETRLRALHDLGDMLGVAGQVEEARVTLRYVADEFRRAGHAVGEMYSWFNLGYLELQNSEYETAMRAVRRAKDVNREVDDRYVAIRVLLMSGYAALGLDQPLDARRQFGEMLELVLAAQYPVRSDVNLAAAGIALSADPTRTPDAARLRAGVAALRKQDGLGSGALFEPFELALTERLVGSETTASELDDAGMSFDETVDLARSLATND